MYTIKAAGFIFDQPPATRKLTRYVLIAPNGTLVATAYSNGPVPQSLKVKQAECEAGGAR